jgi:hypothetical protein
LKILLDFILVLYISKAGVGSILTTLHFVGWVESTPVFVGFRSTQPNLHFAGVIAKCETQQRAISEPGPKSFNFDQTGRFSGQRQR